METRSIMRSFAVGLTCGLRSMTGPAVTRWRAGDPLRLAFAALALGEFIADKVPTIPARTIPPALAFRAISGGYSGWSVGRLSAGNRTTGALVGAAGAILATYVGMTLRGQIVRATGVPDPIIALGEDAIAIAGAIVATRP